MTVDKVEVLAALQSQVLLQHPSDIVRHLHSLVSNDPYLKNLNAINRCLLDRIYIEAVPSSVYLIWLFIASRHSSHFLLAALRDPTSVNVRKAGICIVRHLFHSRNWKVRGWDALGGAEGIKDILDRLPVLEVQLLIRAIANYSYPGNRDQIAECIEELLDLVEKSESPTRRSLSKYMQPLFIHCSTRKVIELLPSISANRLDLLIRLAPLHTDVLRQIVAGTISMPLGVRIDIIRKCKGVLLSSRNPYIPSHATDKEVASDVFPGLVFGMDVLHVFQNDSKLKESIRSDEIHGWVQSILQLAIHRKLSFDFILVFLKQSLPLYRTACSNDWLYDILSQDVIRWWSIAHLDKAGFPLMSRSIIKKTWRIHPSRPTVAHRAMLEKLMITELLQFKDDDRLDVQRHRYQLSRAMVFLLSLVSTKGRFELLQLICKHSPFLNFDVKVSPPSEREVKLVPVWDYDVLSILPPEGRKYLFRRSLDIYRCDEFLPRPDDIGQRLWKLSWQEQCLLWVDTELATAKAIDDMVVTQKAINEAKQRARLDRDSSGRLEWAQAAIRIARETMSLDIYCDVVEWSRRFLRDPLVFPSIMNEIFRCGGDILSCKADLKLAKLASKGDLVAAVKKANQSLKGLLVTLLLLLREPGARQSMMARHTVSDLFNNIVRNRMDAVKQYSESNLATESELADILLESLIPIIIDYEREGNTEGQTALHWGGAKGLLTALKYPKSPSPADLGFLDRLARERDKLWQEIRVNRNPDILTWVNGLPKGLPIQRLIFHSEWCYHILRRPSEAPYLANRANETLFGSLDVVMTAIPENIEPDLDFVDDLYFLILAYLGERKYIGGSEKIEQEKRAMHIWEYYSTMLQPHPLYLELFQDWLSDQLHDIGLHEAANVIQPSLLMAPSKPVVLSMPMASDAVAEWDPQEGIGEDIEMLIVADEMPRKVPYTILNYRMKQQRVLPNRYASIRKKPRPTPKRRSPLSIWLVDRQALRKVPREKLTATREAVILSALLFLDTFTKNSRILQTRFPNVEYPRYPSTYLADEFITRLTDETPRNSRKHKRLIEEGPRSLMRGALRALGEFHRDIPAHLLRDLIWSFMDALKTSPNAPMYSDILWCAFELIKVLLLADQPHLVVDVALRVWMDFTEESSYHRAVSLVKLGKTLTPGQASELMRKFSAYVRDVLREQKKPGSDQDKPFIKVTTVKMLAQALAEADFLSQATCLQLLREIYTASRHIDVRVAVFSSILELISSSNDPESYKLFTSVALIAAGPSERDTITEEDWQAAENGGPIPKIVHNPDRPILDLVIHAAFRKLPERLKSDYVRTVLLPLVQESTSQHTRWMTCFLHRLGLSLSELGISDSEIGPFSSTLVDKILSTWFRYLPATYLKHQHRSWALSYRRHTSFNRIAERLASTRDPIRKDTEAKHHWTEYLNSRRDLSPLNELEKILNTVDTKVRDGITIETILEEYASRAELMIKFPLKYDNLLVKHTLYTNQPLEILDSLRQRRLSFSYPDRITGLMTTVIQSIERVRIEGWAPHITSYPVTLPTPLQCEIALLPSPRSHVVLPALDEFVAGITGLIHKYEGDPTLVMELDSLKKILSEIRKEDTIACALLIGKIDSQEHESGRVETWLRVKLAQTLLSKVDLVLHKDVADMVRSWKESNYEMVRQVGWALDGSFD